MHRQTIVRLRSTWFFQGPPRSFFKSHFKNTEAWDYTCLWTHMWTAVDTQIVVVSLTV